MGIAEIKAKIEKNHQEAKFRALLERVAKYWKHTKAEKAEIIEAYEKDPTGTLIAIKMQADYIEDVIDGIIAER